MPAGHSDARSSGKAYNVKPGWKNLYIPGTRIPWSQTWDKNVNVTRKSAKAPVDKTSRGTSVGRTLFGNTPQGAPSKSLGSVLSTGMRRQAAPKPSSSNPRSPRAAERTQRPTARFTPSPNSVDKGKGYKAPTVKVPVIPSKSANPAPRPVAAPASRGGSSSGGGISGGSGGGINPSLKPGAPGGPPKSAALLETERKMREYARQAELKKVLDGYRNTASDSVNAELLPALNDLQRQMDEAVAREARAQGQIEERARVGDSDLKEIYDRLNTFMGERTNEANAQWDQFGQQSEQLFKDTGAKINESYQQAQTNTTAELDRLGLGGVNQAATAGIGRDQQFFSNLMSADAARANDRMEQDQSGFNTIQSIMSQNAATQGAVSRSQFAADRASELDNLEFELQQSLTGLRGKKGDIEATRGTKIRELMDQLEQRDYNRTIDTEDRTLQREIARANLGMDKAKFEAELGALSAPVGPTMDDELKRAQIEKIRAEIANGGTGASRPAPLPTGVGGMTSRVNQIRDPKVRQVFQTLMPFIQSGTNNNDNPLDDYVVTDPKDAQKAYQAIERSLRSRNMATPDLQSFARMLVSIANGTYRG